MELTWGKKSQLNAIVFSSLPVYSFFNAFSLKKSFSGILNLCDTEHIVINA